MFCCCKEQSSWVFVYENEKVYGICDEHFTSDAHRVSVEYVINIKTRKLFEPSKIFDSGLTVELS